MRFALLLCAVGAVVILIDAFGPREAGGYFLGAAMILVGVILYCYTSPKGPPRGPRALP